MLSGERRVKNEAGKRLLNHIGKKPLLFDGGMGSQLQARGMKPGELPEVMNVLHPDWSSIFRVSIWLPARNVF